MQDAAVYKNDISGCRCEAFSSKSDRERTFQDAYDLIFDMPVIGHDIAGDGWVLYDGIQTEIHRFPSGGLRYGPIVQKIPPYVFFSKKSYPQSKK